jgi:hypothetical protein
MRPKNEQKDKGGLRVAINLIKTHYHHFLSSKPGRSQPPCTLTFHAQRIVGSINGDPGAVILSTNSTTHLKKKDAQPKNQEYETKYKNNLLGILSNTL